MTSSRIKGVDSVDRFLADHPVFPPSLTSRNDFRAYFSDMLHKEEAPNYTFIEATLLQDSEDRKTTDMQTLSKWMRANKILLHVSSSHMIDICRNLRLIHCPKGDYVIKQGDPGDSFYILLQGRVDVLINGVHVNVLSDGCSFGDKALENDAPRSATIVATEQCKLMVLMVSDYKRLASNAQAKSNLHINNLLRQSAPAFGNFSEARLFYMVKIMIKKSFKTGGVVIGQNDISTSIFVVISGEIEIRRSISPHLPSSYLWKLPPSQCSTSHSFEADSHRPSNVHSNEPFPFASSLNGLQIQACSNMPAAAVNSLASFQLEPIPSALSPASKRISSGSGIGSSNSMAAARQKKSLVLKSLVPGEIFGDDFLRGNALSSYTATALGDVEVVSINKKEVLEYFKDSALHTLLQSTTDLYISDDELLSNLALKVKRQATLKKLNPFLRDWSKKI